MIRITWRTQTPAQRIAARALVQLERLAMGELCDEQNEANARRMQQPDQVRALAGRVRPHLGDVDKGAVRIGGEHGEETQAG